MLLITRDNILNTVTTLLYDTRYTVHSTGTVPQVPGTETILGTGTGTHCTYREKVAAVVLAAVN